MTPGYCISGPEDDSSILHEGEAGARKGPLPRPRPLFYVHFNRG